MRAFPPLVVLALLAIVPLAAAEEWAAHAGGITMGTRSGVTGVQFGEQNAVGVRYWSNSTTDGETTFILTTCYASGSGAIVHCERYRLVA